MNSSSRDEYIERSIREVDESFAVIGKHLLILFSCPLFLKLSFIGLFQHTVSCHARTLLF